MMPEIDWEGQYGKLDKFLNLPHGTSLSMKKSFNPPALPIFREACAKWGVTILDHGIISKDTRRKWKLLMLRAGMDEMWCIDYGFVECEFNQEMIKELRSELGQTQIE
jgi:hypothetical protein